MALSKGNKQVAISMPIAKYKELKTLAIQHDMTLSQLLTTAGTLASVESIKKHLENRSEAGVPAGK